jgi:hypothetical protein
MKRILFFFRIYAQNKINRVNCCCDEHILYQSLNALLKWDFLKVFFKENIKAIAYLSQI